MTARRPLLTAVAAGVLLCAGWLVPTAHATPEHASSPTAPATGKNGQKDEQKPTRGVRLADTGSVDTTPYVLGGIGFVTAGGALVTVAVRRSRTAHDG
ncbi:hypothetical protein GCM10020221_09350 [Streptomyces thioluteus]|uniref:LPXTG cell wall anchor domain-containing protein n=1 Tax=Streptomyces thioluteus TaxID=66431 RepID=A0ABN3WJB2_STRTU